MSLKNFEKLPNDKKEAILSVGIKEFGMNSYKDVTTDSITQKCGISKGLLFHYFSTKKEFYLYCLEKSMERLTEETKAISGNNFYDLLFSEINSKISLCIKYKNEMQMVNMASRDNTAEIADAKKAIIARYMYAVKAHSVQTIAAAVSTLNLKNNYKQQTVIDGLYIYINGFLNRYLAKYQTCPENFFNNIDEIKNEMKEYLDMMLYGICQ